MSSHFAGRQFLLRAHAAAAPPSRVMNERRFIQ
jgi:hypothetical protein